VLESDKKRDGRKAHKEYIGDCFSESLGELINIGIFGGFVDILDITTAG
jgi:hypothetical protein